VGLLVGLSFDSHPDNAPEQDLVTDLKRAHARKISGVLICNVETKEGERTELHVSADNTSVL
jgi:hypothetical protein